MTIKSVFHNAWFAVKSLGIAIVLAIALRVFLFASYKIPSPSMEPTLSAGDYILVNKLVQGGRVYKHFDFMKGGKVETKRLWGWRDVKRNDVLVFNFPYPKKNQLDFDLNAFYVKRCVALPGDTFSIENGMYKIANRMDTLGCYAQQLRVSHWKDAEGSKDFRCFPKVKGYNWNMKNFGPLYVPGKGDRLTIDSLNIHLYRNLICYESGKELSIRGDTVLLGNEILKEYTFLKNYYFMAGDNAMDSRDSRYWGLLPEDHIVGKAAIVWKSEDMGTGEYRWERFFRIIN